MSEYRPDDEPGRGNPHTPGHPDSPTLSTTHHALFTALLLAVAFAVTMARLMHAQPLQSANDRSRWCTVWSLVERGTYRIDEIRQRPGWDTIDLVRHEGHFYSTKPPLLSTVVAGLYWLEKQTVGWTLDDDLSATTRLLLVVLNVIPLFVAWVLLAQLVRRYAAQAFTVAFVVATAAWGTLLSPFLMTLNNHTPAAVGVIVTLWAAAPILIDGSRSGWRYALAGFFAAWTCCMELPAAVLGVAVFVLLLRTSLRKTAVWFVPAALVPLIAFFVTNYLATGGWKPFYLYYGTEKYVFVHEGVPSYWADPQGIDRAADRPLTYLLHCTVGHHGVFSLTPVFLLTLWGWLTCWRWRETPLRPLLWLGLGLTLVVFGFYLSKTEHYNYGGVSVALRWMLWLIPFWLLTLVPVVDHWQQRLLSVVRRPLSVASDHGPRTTDRGSIVLHSIVLHGVLMVLLAGSVFSAWYPLNGPWRHPWLFDLMTRRGWIDYSTPPPPARPPFHTWIRELPPAGSPAAIDDYWIEFEGVDGAGRTVVLRLEDAGEVTLNGRAARRIVVTETAGGRAVREWELVLDRQAFAGGDRVSEILRIPEEQAPQRTDALVFLHGVPRSRPFQWGRVRYLKTPLRTDAFRCRQAATRVAHQPDEESPAAVYRCDLWVCQDVPFGVLRRETTVSDLRTGAVRLRSRLDAVRAGRIVASRE